MASSGNQSKTSQHDKATKDGDSCFLEAGPSKIFTTSTIQICPSTSETLESRKKKLSFRKLSVEASINLPLNDDDNELIEEEERSIAEQEKSVNKSSNRAEEESDVSIVKTMTREQIQEHMSQCLQLSTENKINTKNAFALKLIDCMTVITKNEDESNFAVMACQLDAGAKIYSSRVDAVHQQVIKLVETCLFAEKKKKEKNTEDETGDDTDNEGEGGGKDKEKKKKIRKKVIATNDQISRQPKENNPKDMFVRLEALPGDILNKAKFNPEDLSLTLDRHMPFWVDWQNYKPTRPSGENDILDIEIKERKLRPKLEMDSDVDLSSIQKLEPLFSKSEVPMEEDDLDVEFERMSLYDKKSDTEDEVMDSEEMEIVTLAKSRMTTEGSNIPSTNDVVKTIFHDPGESDYHYLKMDNSNFWAGPSYWKRPQGQTQAENKKKVLRKKREPLEVQYVETSSEPSANRLETPSTSASFKKASRLSKRTMAKWNQKKVTYPLDIHFEPETFNTLFHVNIVAAVVSESPDEQEHKEKDAADDDGETHSFGGDDDNVSVDMFGQHDGSGGSSDFRGFPSPSSMEDEQRFIPLSGGSSPFDPEHGFRGWGSPVSEEASPMFLNPPTTDNDQGGPSSASCDVYEGENLVPMVKRVKVEPIRIVAKPNRVDMHHLKFVMLNIIRRTIEDRENQMRDEGMSSPRGSVAFRDILTQLFNSDKLNHRTKEDLTVQMAFLCLLTLTNEKSFQLRKDNSEDFVVFYPA